MTKTEISCQWGEICSQCAGLAEIAHPTLARDFCTLGWCYSFLLTFAAKIATVSVFGWLVCCLIRNKTGVCCTVVFPLPYWFFWCALPACLPRCLPSNELISHRGMTVTVPVICQAYLQWFPFMLQGIGANIFLWNKNERLTFAGQCAATGFEALQKWGENGFFSWQYYFRLHPEISSQGLLLMASMPHPTQGHTAQLEKGKCTVSIPSHPVSHTYHLVQSRHFSLTEWKRKKEKFPISLQQPRKLHIFIKYLYRINGNH